MLPRILLATARVPDTDTELRLYQSGQLYSIKIPGRGDLMTSRMHGSERSLAELACARLAGRDRASVLVGGLGMGFTLRAALDVLAAGAEVVVAELVPEVVAWNRELIGEPAAHPLRDPRARVYVGDVATLIRRSRAAFDAILLDVDNGPEGLVRRQNDWLYSLEGLATARRALRADGVLAVWSAGPDGDFTERLRKAGWRVEEHVVRAHRPGKGARHVVWLAQ